MKPTALEATIARAFDVALDGVRRFIGREALLGVASNGIAHLVESLRRAGLGAEAHSLLVAEPGDLDLARASAPALERKMVVTTAHPSGGTIIQLLPAGSRNASRKEQRA